ncbi:MAG: hypothetical protein KC423_05500 [Anaerolineales bacterium]|nr:hypothetical protein [Anaerolineales bacterium]
MEQNNSNAIPPEAGLSGFIRAAGVILGVSYPVLAFSTGVRAVYQLFFKEGITDLLPPALSAIAALCYLTATVGFAYRKKWAWQLSLGVLGFETLMTLLVGTLSFIYPDIIGRTVWRAYGADYGFFPLFQPILGIAWLLHPATLQAYHLRAPITNPKEPQTAGAQPE